MKTESAWGQALRNRDGGLLVAAFSAFTVAEWMAAAALAVYLLDVGGEAAVGLLAVLFVPTAIAGLGAGTLSERRPPERVLVVTALARAVVVALAAAALSSGWPLGGVAAIVALDAAIAAAYRPAQAAVLPFLARSPAELSGTAGVLSTTRTVSQAAGMVLGGLLIATVPASTVFVWAAALFALTAGLVSALRVRTEVIAHRARGPAAGTERDEGGLAAARDGLRAFAAIARHRDARLVIELAGVRAGLRGAWLGLAVLAAAGFLHMGSTGFGQLAAAAGVGAVLAIPAAWTLVGSRWLATALGTSLAGIALALVGVAALGTPTAALLLMVAWGVGMALADLAATAVLPRIADARQLGHMTAVTESLKQAAEGGGSLLVPLFAAAVSVEAALVAAGGIAALVALAALRRLTRVDMAAGRRIARIDVIRRSPVLRGLRVAELEAVAAAARPIRLPPGGDAVREGDRDAHAFYVIEEGTADVLVEGDLLRTLGPGASFGEIALLHDIQRTATVRARTALDLLELDRSDFVWAVTGGEEPALVRRRLPPSSGLADRPLRDAISSVPWLARLDSTALAKLGDRARRREVADDEVLWQQGARGDTMAIVLDGTLVVEQGGEVAATIGPGQWCGEVALLHDVPRTATVRTLSPVTLCELGRDDIREALGLDDQHFAALLERLAFD